MYTCAYACPGLVNLCTHMYAWVCTVGLEEPASRSIALQLVQPRLMHLLISRSTQSMNVKICLVCTLGCVGVLVGELLRCFDMNGYGGRYLYIGGYIEGNAAM